MRLLIATCLSAGTLAACTSVQSSPSSSALAYVSDARVGTEVAEVCTSEASYAFRNTTDRTVIISVSGQDYLIETDEYCSELPGTLNLSAEVPEGKQCVSPGSELIAQATGSHAAGPLASGFKSRCRIKAIHEWDESQQRTTVASID